MKIFSCLFILLFSISLSALGAPADFEKPDGYSISELIELTKRLNYTQEISGWSTYEAKQRASSKVANLVPRLNLATVVGIAEEDFISVVVSQLGFLYPSNWYEWDKAEELYQAQRYNYEVTMADQIVAVETLALAIHSYYSLKGVYDRYLGRVDSLILTSTEAEEDSLLPASLTLDLEIERNKLRNDQLAIVNFLNKAHAELAGLVGIPSQYWRNFKLRGISLPDISDKNPIDSDNCEEDVHQKSRGLRAITHLIAAARGDIGSRRWAFLHPQTSGEGSLTIGYTNYVNIGHAGLRKLLVEQDYKIARLKEATIKAASDFNFSLEQFDLNKSDLMTKRESLEILDRTFTAGGIGLKNYLTEKMRMYFGLIEAEAKVSNAIHLNLIAFAQMRRLHWWGPYQNLQSYIPRRLPEDHRWWVNFVLDQQPDEGFSIDEFRIGNEFFDEGYILFDSRYMQGTPSFPYFDSGEWNIRSDGKIEMKFRFRGNNYTAVGRLVRTDYLFADTANFYMNIVDERDQIVGKMKLTD